MYNILGHTWNIGFLESRRVCVSVCACFGCAKVYSIDSGLDLVKLKTFIIFLKTN